MGNKVFIIGLDGATLDIILPQIKKGRLPNLMRLLNTGTFGRLKSTIPPITACAWTSFMTGKNPGNTGIFEFFNRKKGSYSLNVYNSQDINSKTLWEIASIHRKKVGIINVPMTYPAKPINGFIITGLLTPHVGDKHFTFPENLFEKHGLNRSDYVIVKFPQQYSGDYERFVREILEMMEKRANVALKLMKEEDWDLFMVHFMATDWASHALWKFGEENNTELLLEVYKKADDLIGRFESNLPEDTTLLIVSDHGFGPTHKTININNLLIEVGLLNQKYNDFEQTLLNLLRAICMKISSPKIYMYLEKILERIFKNYPFLIRKMILEVFWRFDRLFHFNSYFEQKWDYHERINWDRTKAYSIGTTGGIYINLKGREPKGIVEKGKSYEKLRDFIENKLMELEDEKGVRLIDKVYKKEEIYSGKYLEDAPDLIPITEKNVCYFNPRIVGNNILQEPEWFRFGNHKMHGILIAEGRNIKSKEIINNAELIDIAPTVLYLLGIPVPREMDGGVLTNIFHEKTCNKKPPKYNCNEGRPQNENTP